MQTWIRQEQMRPAMQRFGEKLRTLRKQRRMTVRELADALGYTAYSYISEVETGKLKPSLELAIKVPRLFNVTLDQLLKNELELDLEGNT